MPPSDTVSRAEFANLQSDIGDMKSLLQKMVDAMGRLAVIDERQVTANDTNREILKRLNGIEQRQHRADIEAAKNEDTPTRLVSLETAVREFHIEREKDKATQAGMLKMVRWMWAGVPAFTTAFVWAASKGFFG